MPKRDDDTDDGEAADGDTATVAQDVEVDHGASDDASGAEERLTAPAPCATASLPGRPSPFWKRVQPSEQPFRRIRAEVAPKLAAAIAINILGRPR